MVISPDKDILFEQRVTKLRYLEVKASYHNSQSGSVLIVGAKGIYRFSFVRVPEVQNRKGTESGLVARQPPMLLVYRPVLGFSNILVRFLRTGKLKLLFC